jgi:hypothetical protein
MPEGKPKARWTHVADGRHHLVNGLNGPRTGMAVDGAHWAPPERRMAFPGLAVVVKVQDKKFFQLIRNYSDYIQERCSCQAFG